MPTSISFILNILNFAIDYSSIFSENSSTPNSTPKQFHKRHYKSTLFTLNLQLIHVSIFTCFHDVVPGRETFAHTRTDGAEDQDGGQVCVSHQRAPQHASSLVSPVDVPGHDHHKVVRQREICVLTPPTIKGQGHVESWNKHRESAFVERLTERYRVITLPDAAWSLYCRVLPIIIRIFAKLSEKGIIH